MGDGDRPARGDLLLEEGHHAAPAAQHIAEPHRHERAAGALRRVLHDQLGHALGGAHHAAGVDRLVGRDEHEMAHPGRDAGLHQVRVPSTLLVIGVLGVVFHQRHVLVRGRVEDDLRTMRCEDRGQAVGVADVGDDGRDT